MLNQYEVPAYLLEEMPEIINEFKYIYPSLSIYKVVYCLANYTSRKVMQHDFEAVQKCFRVAEEIYCQGNLTVKKAIEKVYVYSFPSLIHICNRDEQIEFQSIMPSNLYRAYKQHLIRFGI